MSERTGPRANGVPRLLDHHGRPFDRKKVPDGAAKPGGIALPPGWLFVGRVGGGDNTMWLDRFDEAMRHSRADANDMLRDCSLRALVQERMLAFTSRKWHLDVADEHDPEQVRVRDGLTRLLKGVRQMPRIVPWLGEGVWYGRAGVQVEWAWAKLRDEPPDVTEQKLRMYRSDPVWRYLHDARRGGDKVAGLAMHDREEELQKDFRPQKARYIKGLTVKQAWPVNGDKIGHQYDGTPFILVESDKAHALPSASIVNSPIGRALSLRGTWRERFVISRWFQEDRDFFAPDEAEAVFGTGVRSHVFWLYWLRQEWLGSVTDFFSRVGLGVNLWKYRSGNPQARQAVEQAARENTDRANIFVPVTEGEEATDILTRVEVPTSGAEALVKLIDYADKQIERYIVGQEGSASASSSSGHSNHESADFMRETKGNITRQDALWCSEAITGCDDDPGFVSLMQKYTYPEADFPVWHSFDIETKESGDRLQAIKTLVDMGAPVRTADAYAAAGVGVPAEGDETLKPPQPQGAPGQPGAKPGAEGGPDAGGNPLAALMGQSGEGGPQGAAAPPEGGGGEQEPPPPPPGLPPLKPDDSGDFGPAKAAQRPGFAWRFARNGKHEFGWAGLVAPAWLADKVRGMAAQIAEEDLAEDGRESKPHVTLRYGIHPGNAAWTCDVLDDRPAVEARLGPVSVFPASEAGGADVVKLEVEGDALHALHEALGGLPHTDTHEGYKPHLTIAYVKPGRGARYAGSHPLEGRAVRFETVQVNDPDEDEPRTLGLIADHVDQPARFARKNWRKRVNAVLDRIDGPEADGLYVWINDADGLAVVDRMDWYDKSGDFDPAQEIGDALEDAFGKDNVHYQNEGGKPQGKNWKELQFPAPKKAKQYAREDQKHHWHDEGNGRFVSKGGGGAAKNDPERDKPTNPEKTISPSAAAAIESPAAASNDDAPAATTPHGGPAKATPEPAWNPDRPTVNPDRPMSPQELRHALAMSPAYARKGLSGGCNVTELLDLGNGVKGVFKPSNGEEWHLRDGVKAGTYYRREVAAYEIAEILGFDDLVPVTTLRSQGRVEGSMQRYVGGAPVAADVDEGERFDGQEDLGRAAALDYLLGHLDRHTGNWLVKDGKLQLIDNGLSLPTAYHPDDWFNMQFLRRAARDRVPLPDMTHLADRWEEIERELEWLNIEPEAIDLCGERFAALTERAGLTVADLPGPIHGETMAETAQRTRLDHHGRVFELPTVGPREGKTQ